MHFTRGEKAVTLLKRKGSVIMQNDRLITGNIKMQLAVLALPLILGNILQQCYNTIDAYIVGHYVGGAAFAAVGVAGSVMNLFLFMISGGCNGISVVLAQIYGQEDWRVFRREGYVSLAAGGLASILLSLLATVALPAVLSAIQTPVEVRVYAQEYLVIIQIGFPAAFLYHWGAAVLRSAGDTRAALFILGAAMGMNFLLDYLLVVVCVWGIGGAAASTVISQLLAAVLCICYIKKRHPLLLFGSEDRVLDRRLFKRTIYFGAVSALHQSSLYLGKLLVQGVVDTAGTAAIAAFTAASRIEGFVNSFGDSGSAAVSVFVAQNYGADKGERIREGFLTGLKMMCLLSIVLSAVMGLGAGSAVSLFAGCGDQEVMEGAVSYLRLISIFYFLCFIGSSFVGYYRGLGIVQIPVVGTVLHISLRVVFSYLLVTRMGLPAVALATGIGWAAVVLFQCLFYLKSDWFIPHS